MECFICGDETGPLYKICRCDILVHSECALKMLQVPSHSTSCAVCKSPYDMEIRYKHTCKVFVDRMFVVSLLLMTLCLSLLCGIFVLMKSWDLSYMMDVALSALMISGIATLSILLVYILIVDGARFCFLRLKIPMTTLFLPDPQLQKRLPDDSHVTVDAQVACPESGQCPGNLVALYASSDTAAISEKASSAVEGT